MIDAIGITLFAVASVTIIYILIDTLIWYNRINK